MPADPTWKFLQLSPASLAEHLAWLSTKRNLHDLSFIFFRDAGNLLSLSSSECRLTHLAFFMAVLGVERALRRHFRDDATSFKELLQRAVDEGWIRDPVFRRIEPLPGSLLKLVDKDRRRGSHSQKLVSLIPALRNHFFHGAYYDMPEFFWLTLQLREIADVLYTRDFPKKPPTPP